MHDGMPYGRNQGQGHSREVDRQSPTGLIFLVTLNGQKINLGNELLLNIDRYTVSWGDRCSLAVPIQIHY